MSAKPTKEGAILGKGSNGKGGGKKNLNYVSEKVSKDSEAPFHSSCPPLHPHPHP